MTTTTSSSKSSAGRFTALYLSSMRRNLGYFGLISALIFVFYPLQYILEATRKLPEYVYERGAIDSLASFQYRDFIGLGKNFAPVSMIFFTGIMLIVPLVLALSLNSYMQSKKAADVYHSLPVRRETLLLVNAATGMTILAVPVLLSNLIIAGVEIACFGMFPAYLGWQFLDMLGWLVTAFAIYSLTAFVATLVGTTFDSFIFTLVLSFTAPTLSGIYLGMASGFLYGFQANADSLYHLLFMSPMLLMPSRFFFDPDVGGTLDETMLRYLTQSNWMILGWALIGGLLLLGACMLYHRRQSERAETTTSRGTLPLIVKMIGTFVVGILTGILFWGLNNSSNTAFIIWALVGGMLCYAILEVILNRGFKTLLRSLPLGLIMCGITVVCGLTVMFGGFGYETRVPNPGQVASVSITNTGRMNGSTVRSYGPKKILPDGSFDQSGSVIENITLREPENIEAVVAFHQRIVDKVPELHAVRSGYGSDDEFTYTDFTVQYRMKNGSTLTRYYSYISKDALTALYPLETSQEVLSQTCFAWFTDPDWVYTLEITDALGSVSRTILLDSGDSAALLAAVKADVSAQTVEQLTKTDRQALFRLNFTMAPPDEGASPFCDNGSFIVTNPSQQTYQLLADKGLLTGLETRWDSCTQVTVDTGEFYYRVGNNGIILSDADNRAANPYEVADQIYYRAQRIREMDAQEMEDEGLYYDSDGNVRYTPNDKTPYMTNQVLLTDPALIGQLSDLAVASYTATENMAALYFHFEYSPEELASKEFHFDNGKALIPYDSLPAAVKDQLNIYITAEQLREAATVQYDEYTGRYTEPA